jgi:hypothetical protein
MADLTALPAPLLYLAMMRSSFGATTSHGAESVSSAFAVDQCNLAAGECVASIPIWAELRAPWNSRNEETRDARGVSPRHDVARTTP